MMAEYLRIAKNSEEIKEIRKGILNMERKNNIFG